MKIIYLAIFLLGSVSLSAQLWQTKLPYTSRDPLNSIRDFITTNDNGFLVLLRSIDEEEEDYTKLVHTMVKYDSLGNFEWDRNYGFGVSGAWASSSGGGATPINVIQLTSDNYLMTGRFRGLDSTLTDVDTTYLFITNAEGDSISFFESPNYRDLQKVGEEFFAYWRNDQDITFVTKLNESGEPLEERELGEEILHTLLVSNSGDFFGYRGLVPKRYKKFNNNGVLIYENPASECFGRRIIENEVGGITAYEDDLIKMDSNLNILWKTEHEEIYPGIPRNNYAGSDIIQTVDDGIVTTGYIIDDFFSRVFISKYTSDGERLWGGSYPPNVLPITYLHQVKEVSDGLVVLGGNKFTEEIWLVKLYSDGNWVTNTDNLSEAGAGMMVYPNPGKGDLNVKFSKKVNGQINVINSQGQIIKTIPINNTDATQQLLSNISSGLYWVQFVDRKGYPSTVKYIVN